MDISDIEEFVINPTTFNSFVYTPLNEALKELEIRNKNRELESKIESSLNGGIPAILKNKEKIAILFRQLATPNYEVRRFLSIADGIGFQPLIWEYHTDKFTSNNEFKHSLGKVCFYFGKGKKNGAKIDYQNIINFNTYNGKRISEVKTLWQQNLINFHHEMFEKTYPGYSKISFFDASGWFHKNGGAAKEYYKNFLSLFVKHGILFENFMLDKKEASFTRDIFLPAFIDVQKRFGLKPLIVTLAPTNIEGEKFWVCHPQDTVSLVKDKLLLV